MHASRSHKQQGRCPPPALPASTDAKSRVGGTALSTDESARAQAAGACAMGLSGGAGGWRDGAPLERGGIVGDTESSSHGGETISSVGLGDG